MNKELQNFFSKFASVQSKEMIVLYANVSILYDIQGVL